MSEPTVTKSKISKLELVYPPMSNQEAIWLKSDPEVEPLLRESDFYLIGGRREIKFADFKTDDNDWTLKFKVVIEGGISDEVCLNIQSLPGVGDVGPNTVAIELGTKFVRIW